MRQLTYFLAVAQELSFTRTAALLDVAAARAEPSPQVRAIQRNVPQGLWGEWVDAGA